MQNLSTNGSKIQSTNTPSSSLKSSQNKGCVLRNLWCAFLILAFTGCGDFHSDLKEIFYPADAHLGLPGGHKMRMHCESSCPDYQVLWEQMSVLELGCLKDYPEATYPQWATYAVTWGDHPYPYEGVLRDGATFHNKRGIYIWSGAERLSAVVRWELLMASLEKTMPRVGEAEKIKWKDVNCPDI